MGTLFTPYLQENHPLTIVADTDSADGNPVKDIVNVGGLADRVQNELYKISWEARKGAVKYRLYGSVSPQRQSNLLQDDLTEPEASFIPPVFTEVIEYYFWVSMFDKDGVETYLTNDPAALTTTVEEKAFSENPLTKDCNFYPDVEGLNCEIKKAYEYVRSGNRLQLENGGEQALLYLRRQGEDKPLGIPCTCVDNIEAETDPDQDYNGLHECKLCFGTGIYGGYYPKIPILIRYQGTPTKVYQNVKRGFQLSHSFDTYMLWAPVVRNDDIVVRVTDGSRYYVSSKQETSSRGVRLSQRFTLQQIEKEDIRMQITDAGIQRALDKSEIPGFRRDGFRSFG